MSLDTQLQSAFTAVGNAVKNKVSTSQLGVANGVATLDGTGKIPSAQLPAYVDDVVEYSTLSQFPATGSAGIIYIALDTNLQYRWAGSTYQVISSGAVISVAGKTGAVILDKNDVGLTNVDNTADADKPVSLATQTALDGKANTSHSHVISEITGLQTALDAKATTTTLNTLSANVGTTNTDYVGIFNAALV